MDKDTKIIIASIVFSAAVIIAATLAEVFIQL